MKLTGRFLKAAKDAAIYGQGACKLGIRKWYNPLRYIIGPFLLRTIPIQNIYNWNMKDVDGDGAIRGDCTVVVKPQSNQMHCALLLRPFCPETVAGLLPYTPFTYEMPCGNVFTVESILDIPEHEVPCLCGDPGHWFIKHELPDLPHKKENQ